MEATEEVVIGEEEPDGAAAAEYDQLRQQAVEQIHVPDPESFLQEFQVDDRLEELAKVLIQHCEELQFIDSDEFTITYMWKRTGGKASGRLTLGKCMKTSGLIRYFAKTDYCIWLAADHLHNQEVNLAALLYHELRHIDRDENGLPTVRAHEFEGFVGEIERFGVWREDMKPIASAFQESPFERES